MWWIGLAIALAVMLRELPHGDAIIVDILVGTFLGDTAAYIGGRAVRPPPARAGDLPEQDGRGRDHRGSGRGIAVWAAGLYQDWLSGADALLLGIGVAIAAPIGDLFESMIKRDTGTKDAGSFGPHGGALDRIDAVLFTVPVGYYIWHALM